jgi:hypothetical protein
MLAAAYDTPLFETLEFIGVNASASGPAVVLELARVLSRRPIPYSVMVVLLDGDAGSGGALGEPGRSEFEASRRLVAVFEREGILSNIRVAAFFGQVGDEDLSIARDLRSHSIYRDVFFESAAALGRSRWFPKSAPFESRAGSHEAFIEGGLPRVVLVSDNRYGGSDSPGRYAWSEQDTLEHCSPQSLAAVGEVTLEALDRIAVRLNRIDRFRGASPAEPGGAPAPAGASAIVPESRRANSPVARPPDTAEAERGSLSE